MRLRDRLDRAIQDFEDINLGSQTARDALIDRVIQIVQNEPTDSKYWAIKEHPLAQYEAIVDDDGNVIRPKEESLEDKVQANSPFNDGWTREHYKNKNKDEIIHPD
tara:strand:+ start:182 stop:499 length:318 start_codon:yes stop_codon:yes gene_type:complete